MLFFLAILLAAQTPPQSSTQPGTIAGQLLRTNGAPAANERVMALDADDSGREKLLASVSVTDSRGRYRLEGLAPGRYLISAGALTSPTYFPGITVRKEASAVVVTKGAAITNIDFRLMDVLPSRVSGRIISKDDHSAVGERIWLVLGEFRGTGFPFAEPVESRFGLPSAGSPRFADIGADGSFEFPLTLPGNYFLILKGMERPLVLAGGWDSSITVEGRDVTGLDVLILSPVYVVQSIHVDDGSPVPPFELILTDLQFNVPPITRKVLPSLAGALYTGDYRISISSLPASYYVKSITSGGVDLSREPLRVRSGPSAVEFSIVLGVTPH